MPVVTELLREDHRRLEERLDGLEAALRDGEDSLGEKMGWVVEVLEEHERREAGFWEHLARHAPKLADKLGRQHRDAWEANGYFAGAQGSDQVSLARRFHAIVQHNLIEEERDVFPLADRCFSAEEQRALLERWAD